MFSSLLMRQCVNTALFSYDWEMGGVLSFACDSNHKCIVFCYFFCIHQFAVARAGLPCQVVSVSAVSPFITKEFGSRTT